MRAAHRFGAMALLVLGWHGAPAWAETICKFTGPDGAVSYAPCGSGTQGGTAVPIDPNRNVIAPERSLELRQHEENQQQHRAGQQRLQAEQRSHRERIADAEAELAAAEEALEAGLVTQPGDFMGKKSGGVRPSLQRHQRLNALQDAVDDARARLQALRSQRPGG